MLILSSNYFLPCSVINWLHRLTLIVRDISLVANDNDLKIILAINQSLLDPVGNPVVRLGLRNVVNYDYDIGV